MSRKNRTDPKARALEAQGVLNPKPDAVRDERFQSNDFFDARDLVQVKYEMVRRVKEEGASVTDAAARFGQSRPTFYGAQRALEESGLGGLLPRRSGPKGPHKLTEEVMAAVEKRRAGNASLGSQALATFVAERFGVRVHPRSLERALARREKKRRQEE
jgi:transposase